MIRLATYDDITQMVCMMEEFKEDIDVSCASNVFDPRKASLQLRLSIDYNLCWVYDNDGCKGFLSALKQENMWSNATELHLVVLWVNPEHRGGIVGGKLLRTFSQKCRALLDSGEIRGVFLKVQSWTELNDKSLSKLGFKHLETTYFKE